MKATPQPDRNSKQTRFSLLPLFYHGLKFNLSTIIIDYCFFLRVVLNSATLYNKIGVQMSLNIESDMMQMVLLEVVPEFFSSIYGLKIN